MSTSILSDTARLGEGTRLGDFCRVGENVSVGEDCQIGHHVVIHDEVTIGDRVRIDDGTVIGKLPMAAANSAVTRQQELPPAKIGSGCIIGTRTCRLGSIDGTWLLRRV